MTAKELLDELTKMIEDYPPCADFPCVYYNEYNDDFENYTGVDEVVLSNMDEYGNLIGFFVDEDDGTAEKEDCNTILIN